MKSYLNYFKLNLISNLQYRAASIAGILTQLFFGFVYIMVYLAFYESNAGTAVPMELNNLVTYLWLQQAFFTLTFPFTKDYDLLAMIKNGNLAYELIRPQNFFIKFYVKMVANKVGNMLLKSWFVLLVAFLLPEPYKLMLPKSFSHFVIFVLALILSCLLISAITVIVHILTMFTVDYKGITNMYLIIGQLFTGLIIPLPFMPNFLKIMAKYLPFRYIGDFPFRIYSGDIGINAGIDLLMGSFIWLIIMIFIGLIISQKALKKAVIQGG